MAAELHDMVADDLRKIYPDLVRDVHIRVSPATCPCLLDYPLAQHSAEAAIMAVYILKMHAS